jgi:phosphoribosylcarboxyaminoimidazole (NCAIR) mutase
MTTPRAYHTATLLPNGTVLAAGGSGDVMGVASAEIYDPVAGTWMATGTMSTVRVLHTATLLPNGTVLAAGGFGNAGSVASSAEIFYP